MTLAISVGLISRAEAERFMSRIAKVTGQAIDSKQFNDNRLSSLLTRLSDDKRWNDLEAALFEHEVEIYEICQASVGELVSAHVDSTTACGHHTPTENGLMQHGHSKDHRPDLAQLKLMTVAVHPHGHWAATQVVPGQMADDGFYLPIISRAREMIGHRGGSMPAIRRWRRSALAPRSRARRIII
jgi:transposase